MTKQMMQKSIVFIVLLVIFDFLTKQLAIHFLSENDLTIIPNFFQLKLLYNTGAAFSMFEDARFIFIGITAVVLIYGWKYFNAYAFESQYFYYGGILFFAGTIGNFIERLFFGKVTDFLSFSFGSYDFAVFNFADVFLSLSVVVLIIGVYFFEKKQKR